jgi:hypothetical protein
MSTIGRKFVMRPSRGVATYERRVSTYQVNRAHLENQRVVDGAVSTANDMLSRNGYTAATRRQIGRLYLFCAVSEDFGYYGVFIKELRGYVGRIWLGERVYPKRYGISFIIGTENAAHYVGCGQSVLGKKTNNLGAKDAFAPVGNARVKAFPVVKLNELRKHYKNDRP